MIATAEKRAKADYETGLLFVIGVMPERTASCRHGALSRWRDGIVQPAEYLFSVCCVAFITMCSANGAQAYGLR